MADHGFTTFATGRTAAMAATLTATLGLAAASWGIAVWQMHGMDMGVATRLASFASFIAVWMSMMAAMMLPGAVTPVLRIARARVPAVPLFVGSYLAVWAIVGAVVYALYRPHGTGAAGAVVVGRPRRAIGDEGRRHARRRFAVRRGRGAHHGSEAIEEL